MTASETTLVIVESPAKAATIKRFLGSGYRVEASYGHVRDLPQNAKEIPAKIREQPWSRLGVDVDDGYAPVYVVPSDKKKHVKRLRDALKGATTLLLATDEDREGESISWHVLQLLKPKKDVTVQRIVFHEVTPEAIQEALANPRDIDDNLVRAQEARRVLDRLYGYSLSPILWKRVAPGLSAGRVQSVAVRLLVERERARIAFHSADYWDLEATLRASEGSFEAKMTSLDGKRLADGKSFDPATGSLRASNHVLLDEARARALATIAADQPFKVIEVETKPSQTKPTPPFITSTLQQEANKRFGFPARRTMRIAQSLYEGIELDGERVGLITYMRTDSTHLAGRALEQARTVIADRFSSAHLPSKSIQYKTKSKGAQEAHEAIRPTDLARAPSAVDRYLDADQKKLYELIWRRTLACQMVPAKFERTQAKIETEADGHRLGFQASGRRLVFDGFLAAWKGFGSATEDKLLPALAKGTELSAESVEASGHATQPPARYNEASLVKTLEEEGIGRPSTYASIISTIIDRGYVNRRGKELVPTFTAMCVTQLLEARFVDLIVTSFTARMESELDEVASGEIPWDQLVGRFYRGGTDEGAEGQVDAGIVDRLDPTGLDYPELPLGIDAENGDPVVVKIGRYGPYVRRGSGEGSAMASLPDELAPDELDLAKALELIARKESGAGIASTDEGLQISLKSGRYGDYLELEQDEDVKTKPKRVSLPKDVKAGDVTEEIARALITLPRQLGAHPEGGLAVSTGLGRYGPYIKHGDEFRSLGEWREACEISLEAAVAILAQPKPQRGRGKSAQTVLAEVGEVAGAAGPVKLLDGRYGPYVTDGKTNASLPKGTDPATVTPEIAAQLLDARRAKAPAKRRRKR